jgi:predicted nucleic acid-binding protein
MTLVEIGAGADAERRARMLEMLPGASGIMYVGDAVLRRADELARFGIGPADAVHVAAAEALDADALLTCDDRLLRAARRHAGTLKVRVCNPITWMKEHEAESHG